VAIPARHIARLDKLKNAELSTDFFLFQQYHFLCLSELAGLNDVDVHAGRHGLAKVVGGIPDDG
ncbi:uncharacterized protein METZ01_LOCUS88147, partial [marine metagenome]